MTQGGAHSDSPAPPPAPSHWLLLRGLVRELRHWGAFPRQLESALDGASVHCLDLPGIGTEREARSPASIAGIAQSLRDRWLALRRAYDGDWGLLSTSLGGMISMQWCDSWPEDFTHVVLMSSSASNLSHPLQRLRPGALPRLLRAATRRDPWRKEREILGVTSSAHAGAALDDMADEWVVYARDNGRIGAIAAAQLAAALRFRAPDSLAARTLVLVGAQDQMVHPVCSQRIARRYGAPLRVHLGAGHDLTLDAGEWVADEVSRWVGERA